MLACERAIVLQHTINRSAVCWHQLAEDEQNGTCRAASPAENLWKESIHTLLSSCVIPVITLSAEATLQGA
jgi:hypothetical protein